MKKIISFALVVLLVISMVSSVYAADSIKASIFTNQPGTESSTSLRVNSTLDVFFGVDKVMLDSHKINTYAFTLLYDASFLIPTESATTTYTQNAGYLFKNGPDGTRTIVTDTDTGATKTYNAYTVAFVSYDKGITGTEEAFSALASVEFRALQTGTTTIFLDSGLGAVQFLPVYTDTAPQVLNSEILNNSVTVSISRASTGSSSAAVNTPKTYTVTFKIENITTTTQTVEDGKRASKPADPVKEGYTFKGWFADATLNTPFDFSTPIAANKTVYAKMEKTETPDTPPTSSEMSFRDVKPDDWFYEGIAFVFNLGLVKGTDEETFSPDEPLTRATLITLLYRLEKEPDAPQNIFKDVQSGQWYEKAVAWAADNKIISGVGDGLFAPDDAITREQIAVILYNYAQYKNIDVSTDGDISGFKDFGSISSWAKEPMKWAVQNGLIKGFDDNTLAPLNQATRAEIATILMRYIKGVK